MEIPIIFLDIDGVLNTDRWEAYMLAQELPLGDEFGIFFDENSVMHLAEIITATGADIVIHSTWKLDKSLDWIRLLWQKRNLPGHIFDITPNVPPHYSKMEEIESWLIRHQYISNYIILDDEYEFSTAQLAHLIKIDPSIGITEINAKESIAKLKKVCAIEMLI